MDYYTWQHSKIAVRDREFTIATKPGLPDTLTAERLLADAIDVAPGERVLDLRCGTGLVGAALLARGADVTLYDDNIVAVEAAKRTLAANRTGQASFEEPRCGDECESQCPVSHAACYARDSSVASFDCAATRCRSAQDAPSE